MTVDEFLNNLPEIFAKSDGIGISQDPQYADILNSNPTVAELVRDLEYMAEHQSSYE